MRGSTFLLALTKIDGSIFVDLIEKRNPFFSFLSLPFLFLFFFNFFFFFPFLYLSNEFDPILFSFFFLFLFSCFIFPILLDTWLNMIHSHKCTTCHAMCHSSKVPCGIHRIMSCVTRHPTPGVSKNVKFQLSRNLMKFNEVTRFRETHLMVKFVSSSEI